MTQSTVGTGFRRFITGLLGAGFSACGPALEAGVYEFFAGEVQRATCPEVPAPRGSWTGEVEIFGNEVEISILDPRLYVAAGERSLIGRFFFEPEGRDRDFIADSTFRTPLAIGETSCIFFTHLALRATAVESKAFRGILAATLTLDRGQSSNCPSSCAWEVAFRAERTGDLDASKNGSRR